MFSGRIDHHGCMEAVMQGLRAHSDSFLAAMCRNATFCYTILSEQGGTKGGSGSHVSMEPHNRTSTVPRFCLWKTEVCCVLAFGWQPEMPSSKVI